MAALALQESVCQGSGIVAKRYGQMVAIVQISYRVRCTPDGATNFTVKFPTTLNLILQL